MTAMSASAAAASATQTSPLGVPRRVLAIASAAVAFAFVLLALPGSHPGRGELAAAAALGIAVVGFAALWQASPGIAKIAAPLAYVAMAAVLLEGGGGTSSGFGGLFLLPLLWIAIVGSRAQLALGFAAVVVARVLPVLIGHSASPPGAWRSSAVLGAVAAIGCITMQQLVRVARLRADELEAAANRLAGQNEQLRELEQAKDGFIAIVSHELRTPLTSIMGYLEILLEDETSLTDEQQQFLATVNRNVGRLATLVNELLFLVQLDAGRLELDLAETDVALLLAEATDAARPVADARNIRLTLEAEDVPPTVCDRGRMAQLIDNLVSNALKYTHEGGSVEVRVGRADDAIAVSVSDTGIGIPADELPQLFGRFFRASSATREGIPGTGLGLAISQAIAGAHGSTITVHSTPARGTRFELLLAPASS